MVERTATRVAFGEVVRLSKERTSDPDADGFDRYVGLEHIEPGDLRIRRWGEVADGTTFTSVFRPGQVLFGKRRAYQRKVAVADFEGVCSGDIYVLESKDASVLLPELLPFICQTDAFFEHAVGTSAGSLSPRTNWASLSSFEFDLPSRTTQERFAAALASTRGLIERIHALQDAHWNARLAAYASLTTGGAGIGLSTTICRDLPDGWEVVELGDVAEVHNERRLPIRAEQRALNPGQYPYYGATGKLDSINEYRFDGDYALVGEDGDHFLKYAVWSMTQRVSGRFNVSNHAHAITGTSRCLTDWVFHYFRHRDIRPFLTKQGSGRLKLKKATLLALPMALPPPELQVRLTQELDQVASAGSAIACRHEAITGLASRLRSQLIGAVDV